MKLVRRQRPVANLVEYLQKEKDIQSKHRDFMKEKETIKQQKRLQALPKAEKRRELARIQREKRLAAEEAVGQETVLNPMAGSAPRIGAGGTDADGMQTPKKNPAGLTVQVEGDDDHADRREASPNYESRKQREKREKKEAKQRAKQAEKEKKMQKKQKKNQKESQSSDHEDSRPAVPPVAARPMEIERPGALGDNSHVAALSLISGDVSEQLEDLDTLGNLEALGDADGDMV